MRVVDVCVAWRITDDKGWGTGAQEVHRGAGGAQGRKKMTAPPVAELAFLGLCLPLRFDPRHRAPAVQHLGETGPLSQGVQAGRKALRIRHTNGTDVREKRPRGFKKRPRGFK